MTKGQWCELAEASLCIAKVINININIEFIININITWFANHVVWQALVAASLMIQQGVRAALPKELRKRVQVLHLNRDYWVVTPPLSARAQVFFQLSDGTSSGSLPLVAGSLHAKLAEPAANSPAHFRSRFGLRFNLGEVTGTVDRVLQFQNFNSICKTCNLKLQLLNQWHSIRKYVY